MPFSTRLPPEHTHLLTFTTSCAALPTPSLQSVGSTYKLSHPFSLPLQLDVSAHATEQAVDEAGGGTYELVSVTEHLGGGFQGGHVGECEASVWFAAA